MTDKNSDDHFVQQGQNPLGGDSSPEDISLGSVLPPNEPTTMDLEKARKNVALFLLITILITIIMAFLPELICSFQVGGQDICKFHLSEKHWEFLHIIFPAEVGLLGAVLAYYFKL